MAKNSVKAIPLTSIDSATFTGAYQLVTTLPNPCFLIRIFNNSNVNVLISYDGTNAHDAVPAGILANIDVGASVQPNNFTTNFATGTNIYVNGAMGGGNAGLVYIAGYYQPQGI